ncbi:type VI secretion system baseplate subunit TssE [Candidatus Thiodictyon syntrophicum]|uniref:Type VI secretion system lysozyme n=1 Tax=Candidatus Thiodictyon syntrophicum TaxID=1166950 RepID=A0A2K8UKE5_9GAMM|nr:type VI secretion system baseplate subunit TssE [Candidatus Thiodictyon syntrophicum]AUB85631.1 type VI secretion system lysozyme [Candidatus Thiodictyon syntrophicum]
MAELIHRERLQPSLLDRLTDDEPGNPRESREQRDFSLSRLRETVLRDLAWLLNTTNLAAAQDLSAYPEVSGSVLNFGIPDLSGTTLSGTDPAALERTLRQAITDFEPRLIRHTLNVRLEVNEGQMTHHAMTFLIEGDLWAQPVPLRIYLKTEIDLEMGDVTVSPYTG